MKTSLAVLVMCLCAAPAFGATEAEDAVNRGNALVAEKKCEAHFYIGELYLLRGDKARAVQSFRECVAGGLTWLTECWSAKAELERLEKP
jgi:lipoprotein NlpI